MRRFFWLTEGLLAFQEEQCVPCVLLDVLSCAVDLKAHSSALLEKDCGRILYRHIGKKKVQETFTLAFVLVHAVSSMPVAPLILYLGTRWR